MPPRSSRWPLSAQISPDARVHPDAVIGPDVVIGAFAIVEEDVAIGAGTQLEPHVFVKRWTTLGENNRISAGTVLGSDPLDKNFTGARSYLRIGNGNIIREHYTISRGTAPESETVIGDGNYIMTAGHIAHNARIGNQVTVASCALVAGYVEIEDQAFVSGSLGIHQFTRIGRLAMVGGMTRVNVDLPPYFMYAGATKAKPVGLNLVGMRRAGFTRDQVHALKGAYRMLFRAGLHLEEALDRIEKEAASEETLHVARFIRASKRGICRE